jgi:dTDP-4-amino-4,6-dideoxygalactose transaminase
MQLMSADHIRPLASRMKPSARKLLSAPLRFGLDAASLTAAVTGAYLLRFDFAVPPAQLETALIRFPLMASIFSLGLILFGEPRAVWRYVGRKEAWMLARAFGLSGAVLLVVRFLLPKSLSVLSVPVSIIVLTTILAFGGALGMRVLWRTAIHREKRLYQVHKSSTSPCASILMIGAGSAGAQAVNELRDRGDESLLVRGFVDDDASKKGALVSGVKVLGTSEDVPRLVREHSIDHVLITIGDIRRKDLRRLLTICNAVPVSARIIPQLVELLEQNTSIYQTRDLDAWSGRGRSSPSSDSVMKVAEATGHNAVDRVYLSPPCMSGKEIEMVKDAFASNWIAPLGPHVNAFEEELAAIVGVPHAAALSSGTAALHLALKLVGVQRGDEVLCSTLTFSATANAIAYEGAHPVFVDSDRASWNMDPILLREELNACARRGKLPKAVVVVDIYGQCADFDPILEACEEYGVAVIEDAAESLGASYRGRCAGALGLIGIFSFNGNKIITTSGGGMLVARDKTLVERARFLATQARDPAPHYQHSTIGYNYRMSNLLAAVGRGQLTVLDEFVNIRRRNFELYREMLGDLPGLEFMPEPSYGRSTRWLTCLTIDPAAFGATREDVRLSLEAENIESRPVWKPMHLQPVFGEYRRRGGAVAEGIFENGLCLPSGPSLAQESIERVGAIVKAACRARWEPVREEDRHRGSDARIVA